MTGQADDEQAPWQATAGTRRRRGLRLWLWPVAIVSVACMFGSLLPIIDTLVPLDVKQEWAIPRDPGVAASRLSALASGMISFTGFVFTIVMLTVQFGTSSLSARLIPFFQRDPIVRVALGVFPATFVYSILISIEIGADNNREFPSISMSFATILMLLSVVVFLLLVQRIADMMRPPRLFRNVARVCYRAVLTAHARPMDPGARRSLAGPWDGIIRNSETPGTLIGIDERRLVRLARRYRVRLVLIPMIGDFVYPGSPLFEVHGSKRPLPTRRLGRCLQLGEERRLRHDPAYGLLVLSDVATKAMSTAINDPTTACQAMDHIEELLGRLAPLEPGPRILCDSHGRVRVGIRQLDWSEYLVIGTDEIRHCSAVSAQASRRLFLLLSHALSVAPDDHRPAVEARLTALTDQSESNLAAVDDIRVKAADTRFSSAFNDH